MNYNSLKYFYVINKIIYSVYDNANYETDNTGGIQQTVLLYRKMVCELHYKLITLYNSFDKILYHVNSDSINTISKEDTNLSILFNDKTEIIFPYENEEQANFILRYARQILVLNSDEKYRNKIIKIASSTTGIQDVIDTMENGMYLIVTAGTYTEGLTINKNIDIEFMEGVIINSGADVGITFTENVQCNIYGELELNSVNANIHSVPGQDVFIEFKKMTVTGNIYNLTGSYGNLILKGESIISEAERNMFEYSANKNLFDVLNFQSLNENLHCNGLEMSGNYFFGFMNTMFKSRSYNFNIEHAQSSTEGMSINYYNCIFLTKQPDGNISTLTGGTDYPADIFLKNCYFDNPAGTNYDIYTWYYADTSRGEINLYLLSNVYGKRGTTNASQGLYLGIENGNEFIIDTSINVLEYE